MSEPELAARIQRLEDIHALQRLRAWYHRYIDDAEFGRLGELFAEDAELDLGYMSGAANHGRAAIHASFSQLGERLRQVKQFIHSHIIESVEGDTATGWAILEARYGGLDGVAYNVAGRYDDEYVRVDGQWLFKTMRAVFYFSTPHLSDGWAGPDRHQLMRRPGMAQPPPATSPNPPV
ncbi:MAG: nuclear transport factor 2 family protein [Caulobacteraceae bacterium]|nr:nuclear transport factor 2 family protein [Caulobacteraceae bacterium]